MAQEKKPKKSESVIPKGLEPSKSIVENKILRLVAFSVIGAVSVILITQQIGSMSGSESISEVGLIFGAITGIVPITLYQLKEVQRKDSVDKHMPVFLLALLSSVQSGSNLIKAIEQTASRNLGALTPPLKNLKANMSWGMPMDEAFERFGDSTGTRISKRVTVLLEMALKIGGDIAENLEMIQKHVTELQNLEKERKSSLAPYTFTIYISFAVFIGIAVILSSQFFSEFETVQELLADTPGASPEGAMFSSIAGMDIEALNTILFNMAIIEAVFGGLAAGKIGAGSYVAGIKHIIVMIVIAVIAFMLI